MQGSGYFSFGFDRQVSVVCCESLRVLKLINITKFAVELLHPGVFVRLRELHLSPQNLGADLLYLLAENRLRNLHLVRLLTVDLSSVPAEVEPPAFPGPGAFTIQTYHDPEKSVHDGVVLERAPKPT